MKKARVHQIHAEVVRRLRRAEGHLLSILGSLLCILGVAVIVHES